MKLIPIIGLEIHTELDTKSKMFCSCKNSPDLDEPNTHICEVCTGQPGTLPVVNQTAIEYCLKAGLALSCKINQQSKFDRKNYFYPDLPKNYQISQYDLPFCYGGHLKLNGNTIGITRIHLEEDTAKLTHSKDGKSTLVDFNRSGIPLMELVTDPNITSAQEARLFCQELQHIFRWLKIATADMEKGQMRCEANVSVQKEGSFEIAGPEVKFKKGTHPNQKVELKNINSFRCIERAITYEIKRQTKATETGETLIQETRGWDDDTGKTFHQRTKESADDYRYFPEPDIPPINISTRLLQDIRAHIPELPGPKAARFQEQYGLSKEHARQIAYHKDWAEFCEETFSELEEWLETLPEFDGMARDEIWEKNKTKIAKLVGGWIVSELTKLLNESGTSVKDLKITPENFAEFLSMVYVRKVNSTNAQKLLRSMFETGADPSHITETEDLSQMDDHDEMETVVKKVMNENTEQVRQYHEGKENVIMFLVGQVMKKTKGKADPQKVQELLKKNLYT